jgi:hypothetical protein
MVCQKCPAKITLLRVDANVRRAIRIRLQFVYEEESRKHKWWEENIKPKMKATRAAQVERKFKQTLQALRITLWLLTPSMERTDDFPGFWKN